MVDGIEYRLFIVKNKNLELHDLKKDRYSMERVIQIRE
jgi:hypothetical protein